jgi:2-polyprenyl-3-methyl-5-hydroxy-6-metoxy-1,4-benzoquinol methylase
MIFYKILSFLRRKLAFLKHADQPVNYGKDIFIKLHPEVRVSNHGILVDVNWKGLATTNQFLENADIYHDRYFERLDFVDLARHCIELANIDPNLSYEYLDIGSGGGSSVYAMAKILPNAKITASDISPQLLNILCENSKTNSLTKDRTEIYCFDIHDKFFDTEQFDLMAGFAILHHLTDPSLALKNLSASLKCNGKMIFIEPLESGSLIFASLCEKVLIELYKNNITTGKLFELMNIMRADIFARLGPIAQKPWTQYLDDKWVFDEPYLYSLAKKLNMSKIEIFPAIRDLTNVYQGYFYGILNDSGNKDIEINEKIRKIIEQFDANININLKENMYPTGIIIFTK